MFRRYFSSPFRPLVDSWRKLLQLPKNLWTLFWITLVQRTGSMAVPFLMLYLTEELKYSVQRAGAILAFYGGTSIFAGPLSGKISDRVGHYRVMVTCLLGSALCMVLIPYLQHPFLLYGVVFFWAVFCEGFRPAIFATTGALAENSSRPLAFGLLRLAVNLGMSIGPAVGGVLAGISFKMIFFVDALFTVAAAIFLLRRKSQIQVPRTLEKSATAGLFSFKFREDFSIYYVLLAFLPSGIVFFQILSTYPVFVLNELKIPMWLYGLLTTFNTIIIVAFEIPLVNWLSKYPYRYTLSLGCLLTGIGFGITGLVVGPWSLVAALVVWTFGEILVFTLLGAYISDISPPGRSGYYMGLLSMSFAISNTFAPWFGTQMMATLGMRNFWWVMLALGVISSAAILRIREDGLKR